MRTAPKYRFAWCLLFILCLVIGLANLNYILGNPEHFDYGFRAKYLKHLFLVRLHGASAAIVLILAPIQVLWLKNPFHRRLGQLYFIALVPAFLTGLFLSSIAAGDGLTKLGYILMCCLWAITGWKALSSARKKDFAAHQTWMVRNFALSFGAVILRLYLALSLKLGGDPLLVYPRAVWVAWPVAMLIGELLTPNFTLAKVNHKN